MTKRLVRSVMVAGLGSGLAAQSGGGEQDGMLASTAYFEFRSDLKMNVHDYLYFVARRDTTRGGATVERCGLAVDARLRAAWMGAVEVYRDSLAHLGGFDRPMLDVRYVLSGLTGHGMTMPPWVEAALDGAEPVYRACVWDGQRERNRAWVASVVPLVERFEDRIVDRLERVYGVGFPEPHTRVDLMTYVSRQGANAVVDPNHIVINTFDPNYRDVSGLEMVFHEVSHTMLGPRRGPVIEAFRAAAGDAGVTLHRDLWHVLLFVAAGLVVEEVVEPELGIDYAPYIYTTGLFDRAWPELKDAVTAHWPGYVSGQRSLAEASRAIVTALGGQ